MDCDNPKVYLILRCFFFFRNAKEGQYQEYCDKKWGRTWEWCGGWWDWELACTTFPFVVVDPVPPLGHEPPFPICHMCIHPPAHWSATILQFYTIKRHHIHSSVTAWDSRTFLQFGQSQIFRCAKAGMRSLAITQCTWAYSAFLMGSYTPRYCSQP